MMIFFKIKEESLSPKNITFLKFPPFALKNFSEKNMNDFMMIKMVKSVKAIQNISYCKKLLLLAFAKSSTPNKKRKMCVMMRSA